MQIKGTCMNKGTTRPWYNRCTYREQYEVGDEGEGDDVEEGAAGEADGEPREGHYKQHRAREHRVRQ
eukprot:1897802-Pyramimonas_sp.AAC.1